MGFEWDMGDVNGVYLCVYLCIYIYYICCCRCVLFLFTNFILFLCVAEDGRVPKFWPWESLDNDEESLEVSLGSGVA